MSTISLRYGGLPNVDWPQDDLQIPDGQGGMSRIAKFNRREVGREFYVMAHTFTGINDGYNKSVSVETPGYGDFWASQICAISPNAGINAGRDLAGLLTITDARTGYNLFDPALPLELIIPQNPQNITAPGGTGLDAVYRAESFRCEFPRPICFVRNSAVIFGLSFAADIPDGPWTLSVQLEGWLEYKHASH